MADKSLLKHKNDDKKAIGLTLLRPVAFVFEKTFFPQKEIEEFAGVWQNV